MRAASRDDCSASCAAGRPRISSCCASSAAAASSAASLSALPSLLFCALARRNVFSSSAARATELPAAVARSERWLATPPRPERAPPRPGALCCTCANRVAPNRGGGDAFAAAPRLGADEAVERPGRGGDGGASSASTAGGGAPPVRRATSGLCRCRSASTRRGRGRALDDAASAAIASSSDVLALARSAAFSSGELPAAAAGAAPGEPCSAGSAHVASGGGSRACASGLGGVKKAASPDDACAARAASSRCLLRRSGGSEPPRRAMRWRSTAADVGCAGGGSSPLRPSAARTAWARSGGKWVKKAAASQRRCSVRRATCCDIILRSAACSASEPGWCSAQKVYQNEWTQSTHASREVASAAKWGARQRSFAGSSLSTERSSSGAATPSGGGASSVNVICGRATARAFSFGASTCGRSIFWSSRKSIVPLLSGS